MQGLLLISDEGANEVIDRHRNWGFTIYRTGYGPLSDHQWQRLLQKLQNCAPKKAMDITSSTEDIAEFQQIMSLFRIDARSDTALVDLNMDQLRQLYNSHGGGQPMNADYKLHRIFLVADDEVLSDADLSIVKCIAADYVAANYIPKHTRMGGQRYFGWLPMSPESVAYLWHQLDYWELERIAPQTIGGSHLIVWNERCH